MFTIRRTREYADWIKKLKDFLAQARIADRIDRLAAGNPGDVTPVGDGVSELRVNYGPGIGSISSATDQLSMFFSAVATRVPKIKTFDWPKS